MKLLIIKTVGEATVFETWHVTVPDDWDADLEDPIETITEFDGQCVSEEVGGEHDRVLRSMTSQPLNEPTGEVVPFTELELRALHLCLNAAENAAMWADVNCTLSERQDKLADALMSAAKKIERTQG